MNKKIIDFEALESNLERYKSKKICAMVKANAYGHGVKEITNFLEDKVEYFGVSSLKEAEEIRSISDKKILIASPCYNISECKKKHLDFIVDNFDELEECRKKNCLDLVHIKINTGMNRFGFDCDDKKTLKKLRLFFKENQVAGLSTHFSNLKDRKLTISQYTKFLKVKKFLHADCLVHLGGSNVINYNFDYDMIRAGLGLYLGDKRVMRIYSKIMEIRDLTSGSVGYEEKFEITKPTRLALIPIGYADGLLRSYSGCKVLINGEECPIVGRICMDLCFVDVTNVCCEVGDEVEVLHNIFEVMKRTKLTPYEIFTNFNNLRV